MPRSVEKLQIDVADLDHVAGVNFDDIGVRQPRDFARALGLVLVEVDLGLDLGEHVGGALNVLPHHAAAEMILVIVGDENLVDFVAVAIDRIDDRVDVPCGIDDRGLARVGIADEIDEVRHRTDLGLAKVDPIFWHRPNP